MLIWVFALERSTGWMYEVSVVCNVPPVAHCVLLNQQVCVLMYECVSVCERGELGLLQPVARFPCALPGRK